MHIAGLQKMTLLDFPGRVACTVFLSGCNFRCPFCHNSDLLDGRAEPLMTKDAFLSFLEGRKGLLDGVCVSGGEPTLQQDLEVFLGEIKALGYHVKLDTNGSRPQVLRRLVEKGLVDHVAMDVKNSPGSYAQTVGCPVKLENIEESLRFLLEGTVSYELRTTVVEQLHDQKTIKEIGVWLQSLSDRKPRVLYLQRFVDRDTVAFDGFASPSEETLAEFVRILTPYAEKVALRGEE